MSDHVSWGVLVTSIFSAAIRSGTPMAFAAIGETLAERSGVINLGLEGLMLVGAMVGVAVEVGTRSTVLALCSAGTAAAALAAIHGFVVIRLCRSQIVSGLAISILGTGISGFLGRSYVGVKFNGIPVWRVPYLDDLPFVGPVFFQHDP